MITKLLNDTNFCLFLKEYVKSSECEGNVLLVLCKILKGIILNLESIEMWFNNQFNIFSVLFELVSKFKIVIQLPCYMMTNNLSMEGFE